MTIQKLILTFSTLLQTQNGQLPQAQKLLLVNLSKYVRSELLSFVLKVLVGVVCSSLIIISFIHLSDAAHLFLSRYENPMLLELFTFGGMIVVSSVIIYVLLKNSSAEVFEKSLLDKNLSASPDGSLNIHQLLANFIEGLLEGIDSEPTQQPSTSKNPIVVTSNIEL